MRELPRKLAALLFAGFLAAGFAFAQSQQQPANPPAQSTPPIAVPVQAPPDASQQASQTNPAAVLRTSSDLVRIDVEVTDRSGKPVKGLKQDQFLITDDGKRQSISTFLYSDIESIETAGTEDAKPIV